MKKLNLYLLLLLGLAFTACENLPDEQFQKKVIIARNGFQELKLEFGDEDVVTSNVTISVSGTSVLSHDLKAKVAVDPDTLDGYNVEKYRKDTVLFYDLLPDSCYSLPNNGEVTVKKGDEFAVLPVAFYMNKIDPYKDYVLPLTVATVSDYEIGESQYSKVLLHVKLSNSFSNTYQPVDSKVFYYWHQEGVDDENVSWKTDFTLLAVDKHTCRFYAGGVGTDDKDRENYIIEVTIDDQGNVSYKAKNAAIDLRKEGSGNSIEVVRTPDLQVRNKYTVSTTIKMNYRYNYISDPNNRVERRFEGALTNTSVVYED